MQLRRDRFNFDHGTCRQLTALLPGRNKLQVSPEDPWKKPTCSSLPGPCPSWSTSRPELVRGDPYTSGKPLTTQVISTVGHPRLPATMTVRCPTFVSAAPVWDRFLTDRVFATEVLLPIETGGDDVNEAPAKRLPAPIVLLADSGCGGLCHC